MNIPSGGAATMNQDGPVTFAVTRRVRPGMEAAFEEWARSFSQEALAFPGHLGVDVIRPAQTGSDYVIIFRFQRYDQLRRWAESPARQEWLSKVRPLIVGEPQEQEISGLEFWFTRSEKASPAPPRYKMLIVTWFALFPVSNLVTVALRSVIGELPPLAFSFIFLGITLAIMTYVVMPRVTHFLSDWLFDQK